MLHFISSHFMRTLTTICTQLSPSPIEISFLESLILSRNGLYFSINLFISIILRFFYNCLQLMALLHYLSFMGNPNLDIFETNTDGESTLLRYSKQELETLHQKVLLSLSFYTSQHYSAQPSRFGNVLGFVELLKSPHVKSYFSSFITPQILKFVIDNF